MCTHHSTSWPQLQEKQCQVALRGLMQLNRNRDDLFLVGYHNSGLMTTVQQRHLDKEEVTSESATA